MTARRITYLALLAAAVALHLVYGQYLTHYMVIFLLCVPVLSLIVSLPSALGAKVRLTRGEDVCRGGTSSVTLTLESNTLFPPEAWSVTVDSHNEFTGEQYATQRIRVAGKRTGETVFSPPIPQSWAS